MSLSVPWLTIKRTMCRRCWCIFTFDTFAEHDKLSCNNIQKCYKICKNKKAIFKHCKDVLKKKKVVSIESINIKQQKLINAYNKLTLQKNNMSISHFKTYEFPRKNMNDLGLIELKNNHTISKEFPIILDYRYFSRIDKILEMHLQVEHSDNIWNNVLYESEDATDEERKMVSIIALKKFDEYEIGYRHWINEYESKEHRYCITISQKNLLKILKEFMEFIKVCNNASWINGINVNG